ncbi:hypothetical protein AK812_SmicGene15968 [Symbiodinium microadriaticum]|uniref:Uncharacterized protein n=1 Tax=Symbiodinium microadriaticum TaxID=2951 RepID=A0A1Q9E1J7_SYMMI|nr:hypothetical protein AK812_SmicGene15968 [Symbiodinium microadriaticum]
MQPLALQGEWQSRLGMGGELAHVIDSGSLLSPIVLHMLGDGQEDDLQSCIHRWHQQAYRHGLKEAYPVIMVQLARYNYGEAGASKDRTGVAVPRKLLLPIFGASSGEQMMGEWRNLMAPADIRVEDIEEAQALASETAQWCEDPLPPFDRGDPEVSALALRKAEAARRAAILKDEVEAQAAKVEACLQAYMDKAQESMQSAVQGTSVKGKRLLKKELEEAQGKLNDVAVQLRPLPCMNELKIFEACQGCPRPAGVSAPAGPSGAGAGAAAPEVDSAEELSDHGYNVSCFVAMCDKEAGAGAAAGPV